MRTINELFNSDIFREEMTHEEEIAFVDYWFDKYEAEGFSKVFCSPYDIDTETDVCSNKSGSHRNGQPYKVLDRVKPWSGVGCMEQNEADIQTLPMWNIQFEDGYKMGAYAEEVIPSEIKENMWRDSDKQFINHL